MASDNKVEASATLSTSRDRLIGGDTPASAPLRQTDRVIINIWSSEDNKAVPGANVGHAALETPDHYISLWPGPRNRRDPKKVGEGLRRKWESYFGTRPVSWKASYLEDCVWEGLSEDHCREIKDVSEKKAGEEVVAYIPDVGTRLLAEGDRVPDDATELLAVTPLHANVRIALYGLRTGDIHTELTRLKNNCPGWKLVGSNCISRLSENSGENCASVAYRMLCAGHMYQGAAKSKASSQTSSVTTPDMLIQHVMKAKEKELAQHAETRNWTFAGESNLQTLQRAYGDVPSADRDSAADSKKVDRGFSKK